MADTGVISTSTASETNACACRGVQCKCLFRIAPVCFRRVGPAVVSGCTWGPATARPIELFEAPLAGKVV